MNGGKKLSVTDNQIDAFLTYEITKIDPFLIAVIITSIGKEQSRLLQAFLHVD